jgi:hypothetical protein
MIDCNNILATRGQGQCTVLPTQSLGKPYLPNFMRMSQTITGKLTMDARPFGIMQHEYVMLYTRVITIEEFNRLKNIHLDRAGEDYPNRFDEPYITCDEFITNFQGSLTGEVTTIYVFWRCQTRLYSLRRMRGISDLPVSILLMHGTAWYSLLRVGMIRGSGYSDFDVMMGELVEDKHPTVVPWNGLIDLNPGGPQQRTIYHMTTYYSIYLVSKSFPEKYYPFISLLMGTVGLEQVLPRFHWESVFRDVPIEMLYDLTTRYVLLLVPDRDHPPGNKAVTGWGMLKIGEDLTDPQELYDSVMHFVFTICIQGSDVNDRPEIILANLINLVTIPGDIQATPTTPYEPEDILPIVNFYIAHRHSQVGRFSINGFT